MKTFCTLPRLLFAAVVALGMLGVAHNAYSQSCTGNQTPVDNSGTEFLLVFMANEAADYDTPPSQFYYQDVYLASLGDADTVTLTCKANGYKKVVTLPPGGSMTVRLPASPSFLVESHDTVDAHVLRVVSTAPIVVYGMNHKQLTADAFLALPKAVAVRASTYMVMAYTNSTNTIFGNSLHPSEFAVAAFEDGTEVTYTPTTMTESAQPANVPITVLLNAGECIQVRSSVTAELDGDLTGSIVSANKPISVFGGHRRAEVEHNYVVYDTNGHAQSSRDHLAEQMPPINSWGHAFIARNFPPRKVGDYVRVLSSDNNNVVQINGVPWGAPLNKGEYRDRLIPYSDTPEDNILAIQTSKPSLVGMYAHSADTLNGLGDPFFALVPPVEQTSNDFTYFISTDPLYTSNWLEIVTERSAVGTNSSNITINPPAPSLPSVSFKNVATPLRMPNGTLKFYSVAVMQQPGGVYHIHGGNADTNGFTILGYGFGSVDSYGYTAGSLLRVSTALWTDPGPIGLPYPGKPSQPSFTIRNILGDSWVWLDSIRITYTSNPDNIDVESVNVPMTYFGILHENDTKRIKLAPKTTPTNQITGVARIYHHTGNRYDLLPLEVDFTIAAGTAASVGAEKMAEGVSVYPNPAQSGVALEFSLPSASRGSVRIFDALGRQVWGSSSTTFTSGENVVHVDTRAMANGSYVYEITAAEAGFTVRGRLVVAH